MSVVLIFDDPADPEAEDSDDPDDFFIHQGRSIGLSSLQVAQQTCNLALTLTLN